MHGHMNVKFGFWSIMIIQTKQVLHARCYYTNIASILLLYKYCKYIATIQVLQVHCYYTCIASTLLLYKYCKYIATIQVLQVHCYHTSIASTLLLYEPSKKELQSSYLVSQIYWKNRMSDTNVYMSVKRTFVIKWILVRFPQPITGCAVEEIFLFLHILDTTRKFLSYSHQNWKKKYRPALQ
jgi:hypothetical protein